MMQKLPAVRYKTDGLLLGIVFLTFLIQIFWLLFPEVGDKRHELVKLLALVPIYLSTALLCLRAARRSLNERKRAWTFFALAFFSWTVGQVLYAYLAIHDVLTYPSLAEVAFLAFVPMMILGFVQIGMTPQHRTTALVMLLDVVIVLIASGAGYWNLFLAETLQQGHPSPLVTAVSIAYPFGDLLLLGILTVSAMWNPHNFAALRLLLLGLGSLLFLLGDTLYQDQLAEGTYQAGQVVDLTWAGAAVAVALAAALTSKRHKFKRILQLDAAIARIWPRIATFMRETMVYAAVVFAICLALVHFFKPDAAANGVMIATTVVTLLALLRQG
ncbi:hypothetical protein HNR42_003655, partial [Deinobacterium chartae]